MPNHQSQTIEHAWRHLVKPHPSGLCGHFPELTRLKYFYGQLLGVHDFQTEQNYFFEKLKLHNRCLHGYGTVCGLKVVTESREAECKSKTEDKRSQLEAALSELKQKLDQARQDKNEDVVKELGAKAEEILRRLEKLPKDPCEKRKPTRVLIECGLALDCEGNELIVRYPLPVDLWQELSPHDRKRVKPEGQTVYLSLCYCPLPVEPVRPVLMDACSATPECVYGKVRDAIRVKVTVDPPQEDERCETCCTPCGDPCLLLARIDGFKPDEPLTPEQIENDLRRIIGPYPFVKITGISWTHGGEYTAQDAKEFLEKGIKIEFSRPVWSETISRGVVDVWVIEGGRGRHADIYNLDGTIEVPSTSTTTWLKFLQTSKETLEEGDRVLVIVRTDFILDKCCYPVDGNNVGGRVPILTDYKKWERSRPITECGQPRLKFGPWTSGNGTPGGTFESWFYIKSSGY